MSRVVERVIETPAGEVGVRATHGEIVVRWFCGATRGFTAPDLQQAIEDLELLGSYPDVWLDGCDSAGRRFMAQLADDVLYVTDGVPARDAGVSWKALKRTLRKMG